MNNSINKYSSNSDDYLAMSLVVNGGKTLIGNLASKIGKFFVKEEAKGPKPLPKNPDELLKNGYKDVSHPNATQAGIRTFENNKINDKVRFDKGKPGQPGFEGKDHYHRYNPNSTGKQDMYLDKLGQPCRRGCNESHLFPGD